MKSKNAKQSKNGACDQERYQDRAQVQNSKISAARANKQLKVRTRPALRWARAIARARVRRAQSKRKNTCKSKSIEQERAHAPEGEQEYYY